MLMVFYYLYAYLSGNTIYIQTLRVCFFFKSRSEVHENTLGIVILLAGVSPEQQTAFYREKKKKRKRKEIEETQRRTICQKGRLNRDRWLLKVQEKESLSLPSGLES